MKLIDPRDLDRGGGLKCIYGRSNKGKTVSSIQSMTKKMMWLATEPRDMLGPIETAIETAPPELKFTMDDVIIARPEDTNDTIRFLSDMRNFEGIKSLLYDSLSYTMGIDIQTEVSQESHEARVAANDGDEGIKKLSNAMKVTIENHGVVNTAVFRILRALGRISATGRLVVVTCLEDEGENFTGVVNAYPALTGKQVPPKFPSFFDLIGWVDDYIDKEGNIAYPPDVRFVADKKHKILAKWNGPQSKPVHPLNWQKIMKIHDAGSSASPKSKTKTKNKETK